MGAIAWEALQRAAAPHPVAGMMVAVVAAAGIVVNGATAWMFMSDINIRGAFLHMAADAGVSVGVLVAGAMIALTGWRLIDPIVNLRICVTIVWSTWGLLKDATRKSLDAVPPGLDIVSVRQFLQALPGVASVHDLHVWLMSTTETALTCHLVMPAGHPGDDFLMDTAHCLKDRFSIGHVTMQIEIDESTDCGLAPDAVV